MRVRWRHCIRDPVEVEPLSRFKEHIVPSIDSAYPSPPASCLASGSLDRCHYTGRFFTFCLCDSCVHDVRPVEPSGRHGCGRSLLMGYISLFTGLRDRRPVLLSWFRSLVVSPAGPPQNLFISSLVKAPNASTRTQVAHPSASSPTPSVTPFEPAWSESLEGPSRSPHFIFGPATLNFLPAYPSVLMVCSFQYNNPFLCFPPFCVCAHNPSATWC